VNGEKLGENIPGVMWIVDNGHGWLRVPMVTAEGLRFSEYSYIDRPGGWLYLEEDCDAWEWLNAHGVGGDAFQVHYVDGDAFVRGLPRLPRPAGVS
jgi:hypothetical protein